MNRTQKIAVVKGGNRKENITKALRLIEEDIAEAVKAKKSKRLFVKINAIDSAFPAACTHIDALHALLRFFYGSFNEIVVGDNSFVFSKNKGGPYRTVLHSFPKVVLSDLSEFDTEEILFKQFDGTESSARLCTLPRHSFTVSLALPKTHDTFVFTGCLKNMFGCVTKNRSALHSLTLFQKLFLNPYVNSNRLKWQNLVNVINKTKPDLSVLDSFDAMEGNGPILGKAVHLGIAMASTDSTALDKLAAKICGIDAVPYLDMLPGSAERAEIVKHGFSDIAAISKKLRQHYKTKYQKMTKMYSAPLIPDIKFLASILRRPHRVAHKLMEKLFEG